MTIAQMLKRVLEELDQRMNEENRERQDAGVPRLASCEIKVLGQLSLLGNSSVSAILDLQRTSDLDALVVADFFSKRVLKEILPKYGLTYDEDSEKIWLPPGSSFIPLYESISVKAFLLDPESALVSKAVKAKQKNKQLIQDAIASGKFPKLPDRIVRAGGKLDYFLEA